MGLADEAMRCLDATGGKKAYARVRKVLADGVMGSLDVGWGKRWTKGHIQSLQMGPWVAWVPPEAGAHKRLSDWFMGCLDPMGTGVIGGKGQP